MFSYKMLVLLPFVLFLTACSAVPMSDLERKQLAGKEIAKREELFDRAEASTLYQTMHPLPEETVEPTLKGKANEKEVAPRMTAVNHHPWTYRLRDAILNREAIVAQQETDEAKARTAQAIAKWSRKKSAALARLPPRKKGEEEAVFAVPHVNLPPELSDIIYDMALRNYLCDVLDMSTSTDIHKLAAVAVMRDRDDLIDYLMWLGADPDAPTHGGLLEYAVENDNVEMARKLLFYGADWTRKSGYNQPLLRRAAFKENLQMAKLLMYSDVIDEELDDIPLTAFAVDGGDLELLDALFQAGANKAWRDRGGHSLLHRAIVLDNMPIIHYLIKAGANVREVDHQGRSLLWVAINLRNVEVAKVLLKDGADPNQSFDGMTPVEYAYERGDERMVHTLLARGANPKHPRAIALLYASLSRQNRRFSDAFLGGGVDPNTHIDGKPLLYHMLSGHKWESAFLLRAHFVDVNQKVGGVPLINLPEFRRDHAVIRWLLEAHADTSWQESNGHTILSNALRGDDKALTRLLIDHRAAVPLTDMKGRLAQYQFED